MAEKPIEPLRGQLFIDANTARIPGREGAVMFRNIGRGEKALSKEDFARRGCVYLGRYPEAELPGEMAVSDPDVDRENALIAARNKESVEKGPRRVKEAAAKMRREREVEVTT